MCQNYKPNYTLESFQPFLYGLSVATAKAKGMVLAFCGIVWAEPHHPVSTSPQSFCQLL